MVGCALSFHSVRRAPIPRDPVHLFGSRQSRPELAERPDDLADQEKVTGCLLARINARREVLTIDMVANQPGMNTLTQAEAATYSPEAVFYGKHLCQPAEGLHPRVWRPLGIHHIGLGSRIHAGLQPIRDHQLRHSGDRLFCPRQ